jgi:Flp pilus assembly pilin Flp
MPFQLSLLRPFAFVRSKWFHPGASCQSPLKPSTPPLGQGMTEYIIVVAVVAVAAIGIYSLLGQTIRNQTAGIAQEIAGNDGGSAMAAASSSANSARSQANVRKGLSNYNEDNR